MATLWYKVSFGPVLEAPPQDYDLYLDPNGFGHLLVAYQDDGGTTHQLSWAIRPHNFPTPDPTETVVPGDPANDGNDYVIETIVQMSFDRPPTAELFSSYKLPSQYTYFNPRGYWDHAEVPDDFVIPAAYQPGSLPIASFGATTASVDEGNAGDLHQLTFEVRLNHASANAVSMNYHVSDVTATYGVDYLLSDPPGSDSGAATITFAPGQTVATITVAVLGDDDPEGDEQFGIVLESSTTAHLQGGASTVEAKGIIVSDDAASFDLGTLHDGYAFDQHGVIAAGQDEVVFTFRIDEPITLSQLRLAGGDVQGVLRADAGNADPTLGAGPDRHLSADLGLGSDPQLFEDPLMPGLYTFTVSRNGIGSGEVSFDLTSAPLQADEAGNNITWAAPIPVVLSSGVNDQPTLGTLTSVDNKDVYAFSLSEPSSVLVSLAVEGLPITLDGAPPIHYEIRRTDGSLVLDSHTDAVSNYIDTSFTTPLIDVSNSTPAQSGDWYNSDPNNVPLDPGTYYISIYHALPGPEVQKYSLWVNAWPDQAANRPIVEDFGPEGPKSAVIGDLTDTSYSHHDFLGLADRNDFFVFYVTERSFVTFSLTNASDDVSINLNLGGLPYHEGPIPDDPLTLPTPDPVVSDIGPTNDIRPGGGNRTFSAILEPGLYNLRAYTETSFEDPAGTQGYGRTLHYPDEGGAFYDLNITSQNATGALSGSDGPDKIFGSNGGNFLDGVGGDDHLSGGPGADTLIGGFGADDLDGGTNPEAGEPGAQGDVLLGGDGDDTYHVDSGLDLVDEGGYFPDFGFGGNDTIISTADFYWDIASVGEIDIVSEDVVDIGNDGVTFVGGVFDNTLIGHSGTDVLFGRGGNDTYRAGDGVDFISLSTLGVPDTDNYTADGHNIVIVDPRASGPFSYDIVFEFDPAKDRLDVSNYTGAQDYQSGEEVLTHAVDDGAGNCYIVLGDGFDYLYLVGIEKAALNPGDFIV